MNYGKITFHCRVIQAVNNVPLRFAEIQFTLLLGAIR